MNPFVNDAGHSLDAAVEALARLDARAAAAPALVRVGLVERLAFREAAGWLAQRGAWVHPLDLALRDLGMVGGFAPAAQVGAAARAMPNSARAEAGWAPGDLPALLQAEADVAAALHLARVLRRLARPNAADPFGDGDAAVRTLAPFGTDGLDPVRFARWRWDAYHPALPPLAAAARAAAAWLEAGALDRPEVAGALLAAASVLRARRMLAAVPLPFWSVAPALALGDGYTLPRLRSDVGAGGWIAAFLHLTCEAARAGLRELDRLLAAAETSKTLGARADPRARLPDALEAALAVPALTAKGLARRLGIAPQTATALLRRLAAEGVVREITGRRSFRAFAL